MSPLAHAAFSSAAEKNLVSMRSATKQASCCTEWEATKICSRDTSVATVLNDFSLLSVPDCCLCAHSLDSLDVVAVVAGRQSVAVFEIGQVEVGSGWNLSETR